MEEAVSKKNMAAMELGFID